MPDRYAILGNPVAHSMSPRLHAWFAAALHDDLIYDRILVPDGAFAATAREFFSSGGCGCNITIPCKLDACTFADLLTPHAQAAGAVNTLKRLDDGRILGDNTDGRGLIADLLRIKAPLAGARILIMGAGGAVSGILGLIRDQGPERLVLTNRNLDRAQNLARRTPGVEVVPYDRLEPGFDLILNATAASLSGTLPPVKEAVIAGATLAYDLMYAPDGHTVFTDKAAALGVPRSCDGFGMLMLQAVEAYYLWRGHRPEVEAAFRAFGREP